MRKKVLLIVVDALASRVLQPALDDGRMTNMHILARNGTLRTNCSAIFPSITPAATASIVTGRYPCDHGIAGDYWYDFKTNEVAYFGADFAVIWNRGPGAFIQDFLVGLNHDHLYADTMFQRVERAGMHAACLNYLIYRGDIQHKVNIPFLLKLLPDMPFEQYVYGPSILRLGDLVAPDGDEFDADLDSSGALHRFGFEDHHTMQDLIQMAHQHTFPDFTVAYFPDNDFDSHKYGPHQAVSTLEIVDGYLGDLIDAYGGIKALLQDMCIVLTGDHSQSDMRSDDEAGVDLHTLLADYAVAKAGTPWSSDDQLVICPNMRVAHIYFRRPTAERIAAVGTQLLTDPRIDQVIWSATVTGGNERSYYVTTSDRGGLHFWPGSNGPSTARDRQGCTWSWDGDLRTVAGHVSNDGLLTFPTYPNAFERIACGLDLANGGHVWVTVHPGHEFRISGMSIHPGGSHGSLHALDSTMPLLVAGLPQNMTLPEYPRTVDIAPLCLAVLGLEAEYAVGASHIR